MNIINKEYAVEKSIKGHIVRYYPVVRNVYFNKIKGFWHYFIDSNFSSLRVWERSKNLAIDFINIIKEEREKKEEKEKTEIVWKS